MLVVSEVASIVTDYAYEPEPAKTTDPAVKPARFVTLHPSLFQAIRHQLYIGLPVVESPRTVIPLC